MESKGNPKKIGVFATTVIIAGYAVTISNFTVGAKVGLGCTFRDGLIAIGVSWIALSLLWIFSGLMGQISGKSGATIYRYVFGKKGAGIPSFCVALCNWVWAIFDYWYVGSVMRNMMPDHPYIGFEIGIILIVVVVIIGIIKDITSLKWLSTLTVPIALAIFVVIFAATVNKAGGLSVLRAYQPDISMPIVTAINLMIASFTAVCGAFSDITKNSSSKKAIFVAMPIGMAIVGFQFIVSQVGAIGAAAVDITSLALTLGGIVFYLTNVFTVFAQANTAPCSSLIIVTEVNALTKIPVKYLIFIQPISAGILANCVEYLFDVTLLNSWVAVVSNIFGPMLAILFSEFYISRKCKLDDQAVLPDFDGISIGVMAIGFLSGIYFSYFSSVAVPVFIVVFVLSFVVHAALRKISLAKIQKQEDIMEEKI